MNGQNKCLFERKLTQKTWHLCIKIQTTSVSTNANRRQHNTCEACFGSLHLQHSNGLELKSGMHCAAMHALNQVISDLKLFSSGLH